jgi:anti-sigma factor RsiW
VADWLLVPDLTRQGARAPAGEELTPADDDGPGLGAQPAPPASAWRRRSARVRRICGALAVAGALWTGAAVLFFDGDAEPFAKAATAAYRTFAEGRTRPVELATSDRDALNRWFAAQVGGAAPIPDLSALGLALLGGRIVPGAISPAIFVLYKSAQAQWIAIEMETIDAPPETEVAIDESGGVLCASWTGAGRRFAIVARAPRARLLELARLVREGS